MSRAIFAMLLIAIAAVGWLMAFRPNATQRGLRDFYSRHPVVRRFAPFALEVLESDHRGLVRFAGIIMGVIFGSMAIGLLYFAD